MLQTSTIEPTTLDILKMLMISIPRALVYFDDAEDTEDPVCLKSKNWTEIKQFISDKVNDFLI